MSHPEQVLERCDDPNCIECHHGYGIFKGNYENFVPCQEEKCMAWHPSFYDDDSKTTQPGFCRLI